MWESVDNLQEIICLIHIILKVSNNLKVNPLWILKGNLFHRIAEAFLKEIWKDNLRIELYHHRFQYFHTQIELYLVGLLSYCNGQSDITVFKIISKKTNVTIET